MFRGCYEFCEIRWARTRCYRCFINNSDNISFGRVFRMPDILLWCGPRLYPFHHNKECAFRKFIGICVHEPLMPITWRILCIYVRECVKYLHVNHDAITEVTSSLPNRCSGIFKIFPKESGFIGMKWQMFINLKTKKWSAHLLKLNNNSWICVWTLRHGFSVC